jgi:glycosyltransferase involved in cell wall biosynthesis
VTEWHFVTCGFPPKSGGVSDYVSLLASALSLDDDSVHVWCPGFEGESYTGRVIVHRELGNISPVDLCRSSRRVSTYLAPRRLLIQWVPHGYGYQAMNVPFALWVWSRSRIHGDVIDLMVHEPFLEFSGSLRQRCAAMIQRVMIIALLNAARRVWVSTPGWETLCRPYMLGKKTIFHWLPVPSNIPISDDLQHISFLRAHYGAPGRILLGHFGTYDALRGEMLRVILAELLSRDSRLSTILMGRGSEVMRQKLLDEYPGLKPMLYATGHLEPPHLSRHISACDLMIQPYPDGVSTRRTSLMAALSHGRPVVTTRGRLTESLWKESGAVALAAATEVDAIVQLTREIIANKDERERLGVSAKALYSKVFDISLTVAALRASCV